MAELVIATLKPMECETRAMGILELLNIQNTFKILQTEKTKNILRVLRILAKTKNILQILIILIQQWWKSYKG